MASYSPVTRIPLELIHEVCKVLRLRDLQAVRFISPEFAAVGLTYLMSTVSFALAPTSIWRLEYLSEHPVWSKLIKTVEYELSVLHLFNRVEDMPSDFDTPIRVVQFMKTRGVCVPSRQKVINAWELYKSVRDYQQLLENDDKRRSVLGNILARFPNLASFRCVKKGASNLGNSAIARLRPVGFPVYRDGVSFGAKQFEDILCITAQDHILATNLQPTSEYHIGTRDQAKLPDQGCLTSLATEMVHWPFFAKLMKSKTLMHSCEIVLQHLSILDLRVPIATAGVQGMSLPLWQYCTEYQMMQGAALRTFLALAPKLKSLLLNFSPDHGQSLRSRQVEDVRWPGTSEYPIKYAIGSLKWSNLRHLHLCTMRATSEDLLEVLMRHAETLRSLHLERVILLTGSCGDIVDDIVDILNLKELCFTGTFLAESGSIAGKCNATIHFVKKDDFVISWPKFGDSRLGDFKIRLVLGVEKLGRILCEEKGGTCLPAQCMDWWATGPRKLGEARDGDAKIPTLYIA